MNTRFLPVVVVSFALAAASLGVAAQGKADSAGLQPAAAKLVSPGKVDKTGLRESQRSDALSPKAISERGGTKPAVPAAVRHAPSGAEKDAGCHSSAADA